MPVYSKRGSTLKAIKEKPFRLEKNLQKLTEENLQELFGLEFVATEFQVGRLWIDTLAFNSETRSFVIIEYKKGKNISVIDQGFSYLSLMLNNKAEFILEYNEIKSRNLKRDDIDWSQARVYFVSPEFTAHQQNAINFKDLPIELWQITAYEKNLVLYRQLLAEGASASIQTLSKDKQITKVVKEVKEYSEEDVIGKDKKVTLLYSELKEKIALIDARIAPNPTSNYVGFQMPENWRVIFNVRRGWRSKEEGKGLAIELMRSQPKDYTDPKNRLEYLKKSKEHFNQHMSRLYIFNVEDVEYASSLLRQAYDRFMKEFYS